MKKITYLIALLFLTNVMLGQEETKADSTKINLGAMELILVENQDYESDDDDDQNDMDDDCDDSGDLTYWSGVDMGINFFVGNSGQTNFEGTDEWLDLDYAHSFHWGINLMEKRIKLVKDYVGIVTGFGFSYDSYGLQSNVMMNREVFNVTENALVDSTYGVIVDELEYSKNKMRVSSLNIPLLLQLNTSSDKDRNFHVAGGLIGNWNYRTMVKSKYEEGGHKQTIKEKGNWNTTDFTVDATVRVGFKNFTLFGTVGATPFFKAGQGPEVTSARVGIMLANF